MKKSILIFVAIICVSQLYAQFIPNKSGNSIRGTHTNGASVWVDVPSNCAAGTSVGTAIYDGEGQNNWLFIQTGGYYYIQVQL